MHCSHCGVCCTETEMLLSEADIKRLVDKGFSLDFFVKFDKQGYAQLRNFSGYCVFYDLHNRRCSIYANRPEGCRVYPVILDEEIGIILDEICERRCTINLREKMLKGKQVVKLLKTIDKEATSRCQ